MIVISPLLFVYSGGYCNPLELEIITAGFEYISVLSRF